MAAALAELASVAAAELLAAAALLSAAAELLAAAAALLSAEAELLAEDACELPQPAKPSAATNAAEATSAKSFLFPMVSPFDSLSPVAPNYKPTDFNCLRLHGSLAWTCMFAGNAHLVFIIGFDQVISVIYGLALL